MFDIATLTRLIGAPVTANEPLARHNSWRVGGPADFFVQVKTLEQMVQAVQVARAHGLPFFILGRGTNILIADAGVRGLVIAEQCDSYMLFDRGETALLSVDAGAALPLLANTLAKQGWAGLEWAVGIPSAIGSAIVNNAGAHGSCIADVIDCAVILDTLGKTETIDVSEMQFAYRSSRFKGQQPRSEVVLNAELLLKRDTPAAIGERLRKYNEHRRATQPSDPSAGSVFKNPPNDFAGRLIEAAGLKGARIGGAQISTVHANFFVNMGDATANDLLALIRLAQARVRERFDVQLEPEIELVGEW